MKIQRPILPQNCRIICVSDIHANCEGFTKLLKKCNYNKDNDYLFILGDIAEKGKQNIETIRFVMELCQSPNVICIKGNNDTMCIRMAFYDSEERFLDRIKFRPHNTFVEMGKAIGIDDFGSDLEKKRQKVNEAFSRELGFMDELPLAIETKSHIFVHAGIEKRTDWENTEEKFALTRPWYLRLDHESPKTVVCGHYPTYNYRRANNTNLPIIDKTKRMICVDGGASTKWAQQLNAFIINYDKDSFEYETVFLPFGEEKTVIKPIQSHRKPVYADWENHTLSVIEKQGDFLLVKINQTGEQGLVPESHTGEWDGKLHSWIHLNAFLSAREGERFYVNGETEEYYFGIAENGQVGFLPKDYVK